MVKKYLSLKKDLMELLNSLTNNPEQGTALGNGFYKIRVAISSKGKGKSGGARVITYVKVTTTTVYLTSIYDKFFAGLTKKNLRRCRNDYDLLSFNIKLYPTRSFQYLQYLRNIYIL